MSKLTVETAFITTVRTPSVSFDLCLCLQVVLCSIYQLTNTFDQITIRLKFRIMRRREVDFASEVL